MLFDKQQERAVLETCLQECKRRLNHFRDVGDDIQAALHEADMNRILEDLQFKFYRRTQRD